MEKKQPTASKKGIFTKELQNSYVTCPLRGVNLRLNCALMLQFLRILFNLLRNETVY